MSEAARRLFVSQPGLTKAIRELEQEMGIIIFDRTNKGIEVSKDGAIFLGYARQVLEQASLLEERYKLQAGGKKEFSVSTQHYSFAVNAFVDLIKEFGGDNYDFSPCSKDRYGYVFKSSIVTDSFPANGFEVLTKMCGLAVNKVSNSRSFALMIFFNTVRLKSFRYKIPISLLIFATSSMISYVF